MFRRCLSAETNTFSSAPPSTSHGHQFFGDPMGVRRIDFWPRQLMRRLLKSSAGAGAGASSGEELSCSSDEALSDIELNGDVYSRKDVPAMLVRGISETLFSEHINTEEIRVVCGTWNVAGRTPPSDLELERWLQATDEEEPADLYVIGFQEIVPLNAGNVFGAECEGPASKWDNLIRRALNKTPNSSVNHRRSVSMTFDPTQLQAHQQQQQPQGQQQPVKSKHRNQSNGRRSSVCSSVNVSSSDGWVTLAEDICCDSAANSSHAKFVRIVNKQMVGILITVWARHGLKNSIRNVKVCSVGCGLMGYLGNKGAISVSMSVHETSFCFVCSHLTSGEREGDELRRNSDFTEIMRRTYFHRPKFTWPEMPETIMEHDRIIWLGDLNYRLAMPDVQARQLVMRGDWPALLKRDQLRLEKVAGRAFDGWQEGRIDFPPTYKYVIDSDRYSGEPLKPGEKRRTPAWCDRILWFGRGLRQLHYGRAEFRFSDHRPVFGVFLAEVEVFEDSKLKNIWTFSKTHEKAKELLGIGNLEQKIHDSTNSNTSKNNNEVPSAIAVY